MSSVETRSKTPEGASADDEAQKREQLRQELLAMSKKSMTGEYADWNVSIGGVQETRKADERIRLAHELQSGVELAVAVMAFQNGELLESTPEGMSSFMQEHGEDSLDAAIDEINRLEELLKEEDPDMLELKTTETFKKLGESREKLVLVQHNGKKGIGKTEYQERLADAEKEYSDAFVKHMVEVIKLDPQDALKAGYTRQVIEKIRLGIERPQEITEQELFGTYGFVLMDALARESLQRQQMSDALREKQPSKFVDKLKKSKAVKIITAGAFLGATAMTVGKGYLPESFESVTNVLEHGLKYLGVYAIGRETLKKAQQKLTSTLEKRKTNKAAKEMSSSQETAEAGLRTVYSNIEYEVPERQAEESPQSNQEKFTDIDWHFKSNLAEYAPRGIPYSAEEATQLAHKIAVEHGDEIKNILQTPGGQEAVFADLSRTLLGEDIATRKEEAKSKKRQNLYIHLTSVLTAVFGADILKTVDDLTGSLEKPAKLGMTRL